MPYAFPGQAIVGRDGRRVVVGGDAVVVRTYADFQAHIATLGATSRVWAANANATGAYTTNAAAPTGTLTGSSWGPSSAVGFIASTASSLDRIVQHGMPSQAAFDEQVTNSGLIYLDISAALSAAGAFPAVTRNGFTSSAAGTNTRRELLVLRYWNFTLGQAEEMQPSLGVGPTVYTW